jgi:hypothetical protein
MAPPIVPATLTRRYVPPGGFGIDGHILTRAEWTAAVRAYVRKYGWYARTVRTMTALRNAAAREYINARVS